MSIPSAQTLVANITVQLKNQKSLEKWQILTLDQGLYQRILEHLVISGSKEVFHHSPFQKQEKEKGNGKKKKDTQCLRVYQRT